MTAPTYPDRVASTLSLSSESPLRATRSGPRERSVEHLVGGRVVSCWLPSLCEVCTPAPVTVRLDPYRLRHVPVGSRVERSRR